MVNESGEVVNAYDYDAFGKAIFTLETGASMLYAIHQSTKM